MAQEHKPGCCKICGAKLYSRFRSTGRCKRHQVTPEPEVKLTADTVEAKSKSLSYGQYIAQKEGGMAEVKTCEICRKPILTGDSCHFVKVKGQPIRWYCKKCVKGGDKHGKGKADGRRGS